MKNKHLKDELTKKIGVLMRRETEVRILIPFLQGLYEEFGKEKILNVLEYLIYQSLKALWFIVSKSIHSQTLQIE